MPLKVKWRNAWWHPVLFNTAGWVCHSALFFAPVFAWAAWERYAREENRSQHRAVCSGWVRCVPWYHSGLYARSLCWLCRHFIVDTKWVKTSTNHYALTWSVDRDIEFQRFAQGELRQEERPYALATQRWEADAWWWWRKVRVTSVGAKMKSKTRKVHLLSDRYQCSAMWEIDFFLPVYILQGWPDS